MTGVSIWYTVDWIGKGDSDMKFLIEPSKEPIFSTRCVCNCAGAKDCHYGSKPIEL